MKRFSFVLALILAIASFGAVNAQEVSDSGTVYFEVNSNALWDDGGTAKLIPNTTVTIDVQWDWNGGTVCKGMTDGFKISADGPFPTGTFTRNESLSPFFNNWGANLYGVDGAGADTFAIFGLAIFNPGLPAGSDVSIGTINLPGGVDAGVTLCIDSTWYPPTGRWLWAPGPASPFFPRFFYGGNFDDGQATPPGGICFLAEAPPNLPPTWNACPAAAVTVDHCGLYSFPLAATDPDGDDLDFAIASGPGVLQGGNYVFNPGVEGITSGNTTVTLTVSDGFNPAVECMIDIVVENNGGINITNCLASPRTVGVGIAAVGTLTADDVDACDNAFTWTVSDDAGQTVSIDNSGNYSFTSATPGLYVVCFEVTDDGTNTDECCITFNVIAGSRIQVVIGEESGLDCIGSQEEDGFVFQGQHVLVPVTMLDADIELGGYNFLISYDATALSFTKAILGEEFGPAGCGWEYFTYRVGADGNCDGGCPTGLVRVTAVAEWNNGPNHPACGTPDLPAVLFYLDFLVTPDRNFECTSVPIRFFWTECGDNGISNETGDTLYIAEAIYDGFDGIDAKDNIFEQVGYYPTYQGPQYALDCGSGSKKAFPAVSFENSCLWIACADSIDDRGDINLNNVAYEIADAVLYSNYFVYGSSVFSDDMVRKQGQIAASDVNADGIALSVADLVYLIRVVIGDAVAYDKLAPVSATYTAANGNVVVNAEMGAAAVTYAGNVTASLLAQNMEILSAYDATSNTTRVLVYSMEGNTFTGEFVSANGAVVNVEFGSVEGGMVSAKLLPADFSLEQNYPNPFNPTSTIAFSVPVATQYNLTIFNVTGQKVAEFAGNADAGRVEIEWNAANQASGIYFYNLKAGNFTDTKKMVLLK